MRTWPTSEYFNAMLAEPPANAACAIAAGLPSLSVRLPATPGKGSVAEADRVTGHANDGARPLLVMLAPASGTPSSFASSAACHRYAPTVTLKPAPALANTAAAAVEPCWMPVSAMPKGRVVMVADVPLIWAGEPGVPAKLPLSSRKVMVYLPTSTLDNEKLAVPLTKLSVRLFAAGAEVP